MRAAEKGKAFGWNTGIVFVLAFLTVFIIAPIVVVVMSSVTSRGYLSFPPVGFSLEWFVSAMKNESFSKGFLTSLLLGFASTFIVVAVGVPASYAIARMKGWVGGAVEQFLLAPLLMPAVVLGLGLLYTLSGYGLRGSFLGGLLAHVVVTTPFLVRSVVASFRELDPRLEEASRSMGASAWRTFTRVLIPSVRGGIISGATLAFIISFDEAVVTQFLTGPRFSPLPISVLTYVEYSNDPSIAAISTIIVVVTAAAFFVSTRFGKRRS